VETRAGKPLLVVQVGISSAIVSCGGRYLKRVGTTNRDFTPDELARQFLTRSGQTWDSLLTPYGIERVQPETLTTFVQLARPRLPYIDPDQPQLILENLGLLREGRLTNAGLLLFGRRPQERFVQARVRIGVFRSPTEVAVINALIHRDYTVATDIQIRHYDNELSIWNPGGLPSELTVEQLREPQHLSVLRNPLLAQAFYFAGLIERWGTGTARIIALCREQGLPEPEFNADALQFRVRFLKDPYTPERLRKMGLNERQVQAVNYAKEHGKITNREYRQITGVSDEGARLDLRQLVELGIFQQQGRGRNVSYIPKRFGE